MCHNHKIRHYDPLFLTRNTGTVMANFTTWLLKLSTNKTVTTV